CRPRARRHGNERERRRHGAAGAPARHRGLGICLRGRRAMKKTFALALGGGGARGLAHIAVLEALDEMRIRPAAIAGTSIASSIALPALMRPVVIADRVLIDGGATNPLPFEELRGCADIVVAVDISGAPTDERRDIPNPWECLLATVLVMANAITAEKVKHGGPDLIVRPNVGAFRALDFLQA